MDFSIRQPLPRAALATSAILAAGCASTPSSNTSGGQQSLFEGKVIAVQTPPPTPFALISSSMVLASAIDPFVAGMNAARASQAGRAIVEQDQLVDPATLIVPALVDALQSHYRMRVIEQRKPPNMSESVGSEKPDLYLKVKVRGWGSMYQLANLTRYGVMLIVDARIVEASPSLPAETAATALTNVTAAEVASEQSVREATCTVRPRSRPDSPTFTELMENNGARLRTESEFATQACIENLVKGLLTP